MPTREEDAATIITEELAEELEEEAKLEGKSEATDGNPEVVIKADEDIEVEEKREKPSDYEDDEEEAGIDECEGKLYSEPVVPCEKCEDAGSRKLHKGQPGGDPGAAIPAPAPQPEVAQNGHEVGWSPHKVGYTAGH